MSDFLSSPLGKLDGEERLISPVFKGATAGGFAFRGEIGIKLAKSIAGEIRPPEIKTDQVFMFTGNDSITFYSSFIDNLADLEALHALLSPFLIASGKYVIYAGNVDLLKKYSIKLGEITWLILPLDEGTVYNELLDLCHIEKGDLKKLDMGEKIETLAAAAGKISAKFPETTWDQALKEMGPVKVYENRPV